MKMNLERWPSKAHFTLGGAVQKSLFFFSSFILYQDQPLG